MINGTDTRAASTQNVIDWARQTAIPIASEALIGGKGLTGLGSLIGSAPLVALGEPAHMAAEPLEFRNGLLEYLVREKGFTAIAIESGIAESRAVFDFVRGGAGDLDAILREGLSWGFDGLPQNRDLIAWLRDYNVGSEPDRMISFYGFDLPGSPGVTDGSRGLEAPFEIFRTASQGVDPDAASRFAADTAPIVRKLVALRFCEEGLPEGELLSRDEHDALTDLIDQCVRQFEGMAGMQNRPGPPADRDWLPCLARSLQQLDRWIRTLCGQDHGASTQVSPAIVAQEHRDRAQADNLDWIVEQEGPEGKVLIFAHRHHLSGSPVTRLSKCDGSPPFIHQVAGTYLRARHGPRLVTIGQVAGGGALGTSGAEIPFPLPQIPSLDAILDAVAVPAFVLDMRGASAGDDALPPLVNEGHSYRSLIPASAFDLLLYTDKLTPAVPGRPHPQDKGPLSWN
jgi:erythromycin esterase